MRKYQNALLAGVAALAIATGAGFAAAQTHGAGSMGGGPSSGGSEAGGQSPVTQAAPSTSSGSGGTSQHTGAGMRRGATGSGSTGSATRPQAQEHPGAVGQKGEAGSQRNAQGAKSGTAMQGKGAAPASGAREGANVTPENGGVKFSERQRTTIKRTIINSRHAPKVGHVDFDVRVGTVVPRGSIHITTVPETLVRIEPRWRGYLYFVYEDEIVVVNPHDMRIVAVVAV